MGKLLLILWIAAALWLCILAGPPNDPPSAPAGVGLCRGYPVHYAHPAPLSARVGQHSGPLRENFDAPPWPDTGAAYADDEQPALTYKERFSDAGARRLGLVRTGDEPGLPGSAGGRGQAWGGRMNTLRNLRAANVLRQVEWQGDTPLSLTYRGNELAGEVGEACNVIKKVERERLGLPGSRDTLDHLAEELADVVICVDLIAGDLGIDLDQAIVDKFNATSAKVGLSVTMGGANG